MSSPPATSDGSSTSDDSSRDASSEVQLLDGPTRDRVKGAIAKPVRVASFWIAIVLPFLHVPLLARGLSDATETITFLSLLLLNLVALYVGHSHRN